MKLLTFNHYSIDRNSSTDEIDNFFLDLVKGIHTYTKSNKSQLYTEIDNLSQYELSDDGYTISRAIIALKHRDLQLNILDLITSRCNHDCLNKLSENEQEQILNYEIYLKDEGDQAKDYILLAFALENNAILLSFNRGIWSDFKIQGVKKENYTHTDVILYNIATEEHAIFVKLPTKNIVYSDSFKNWLLAIEPLHRDKIIEKIEFVASKNFEGGRENLIEHITTDKIHHLKEITVGSAGGMSFAQIRIFFKSINNEHYIYHGFIKQNEKNQDKTYIEEILNTEKIIKDEKLNGL